MIKTVTKNLVSAILAAFEYYTIEPPKDMRINDMFTRLLGLFTFGLVLAASASAQQPYTITADSLMHHIEVLADDSLEGREVGEPGEWKAALYIKAILASAGLAPIDADGDYLQPFDFIKSIDVVESSELVINDTKLTLDEEWEPMKQSASDAFSFVTPVFVDYGIVVDSAEGSYNDYEGKDVEGKAVVIKRFSPPADDNPHIDFSNYESLTSKIMTAQDRGATGVIFYTPEEHDDTLLGITAVNLQAKDIPIIFLRRAAFERLGLDLQEPDLRMVTGNVELVKTRDTAYNVMGYLRGRSDTTIVVAAHYDHLGYGGPSSLYRGAEKLIHNGADDNGSGVSTLLELARHFGSRPDQMQYSFLAVAFSGEESGLLGSSDFVNNWPIDSSRVRMMLNMDMIGRLKDQDEGLAVLGVGTAEEFQQYFEEIEYDGMKIVTKESGTGPSDHTLFYNRDIPCLHFFTGAHEDYHKPSDDVEKIDAEGLLTVASFIGDVIAHFDSIPEPLTFQKTKSDTEGKRRAMYSVTLGIMPDYVYEEKGLRVDGVIAERPGEAAGLLEGDVILKMGDIEIGDIYDYMGALSKFRKGDTAQVVVSRQGETKALTVIF